MRPTDERPDEDFDQDVFEDRRVFQPRPPSGRGRRLMMLAIVAFVALIAWPSWAAFYTNWLWFEQLGYQTIFSKILRTKFLLALIVGAISALALWLNFKLALRLAPAPRDSAPRFFTIEGKDVPAPDFAALASRLAMPLSLLFGAFMATAGWSAWETYLLYRNRIAFGETDPIFGRDIAFYFFTLPAMQTISGWLFLLVAASLIGAALVYLSRAAGSLDMGNIASSFRLSGSGARSHLLGLVAALFLVFAWQIDLNLPNLLFSDKGVVAGAGYTDLNATAPLLRVRMGAALIVAILAIASIFLEKNRLIWIGLGLYALAMIAGVVYPPVLQRFSVAPNELAKETPYIQHNIAATRKAFALDRVEERELAANTTLTAADIRENQLTINNIRLWDQQPLLDTFAQIQEIRPYYEFNSVDNDRYRINNGWQQVMLSARELPAASLPNRNWINERLTFTHGFGLTLGPVNQVTPEGMPVLYVKDIPPASSVESLKVTRPEIYFGEMTGEHVYVKTNAKEFNYPSGEENVFADYQGEGGVTIGSLWRRLPFATRFADMKLLLSNDLTAESRVLFHRDIKERLKQIAPFLLFDGDPYLVIHEGRCFWLADAYTTSSRYPYSQPVNIAGHGAVNYMRNSVKALVDAYHGHVTLYIADDRDPLIQSYARIFPGTLKPLAEMPAGLREHLRYPEDIFRVQTAVYSTYHMDQPQVFYNKEDQWTAAVVDNAARGGADRGAASVIDPYYTIMKLPGEKSEEFILMLPFTPKNKDNLASWMVARADGEHYGKLSVYRFPKQQLVYGPKQVIARINQDPEISRQLSLWDQRGSKVVFGTLMVIPIKESLLYVRPLYLHAETTKIPELRRVIVVAENRIAMEPTLDASLARIFGATATPAPAPTEMLAQGATTATQASTQSGAPAPTDSSSLSAQAKQHYDRAIQAQRDGDWARYGEEIKQLGTVLEQLAKQKQ